MFNVKNPGITAEDISLPHKTRILLWTADQSDKRIFDEFGNIEGGICSGQRFGFDAYITEAFLIHHYHTGQKEDFNQFTDVALKGTNVVVLAIDLKTEECFRLATEALRNLAKLRSEYGNFQMRVLFLHDNMKLTPILSLLVHSLEKVNPYNLSSEFIHLMEENEITNYDILSLNEKYKKNFTETVNKRFQFYIDNAPILNAASASTASTAPAPRPS